MIRASRPQNRMASLRWREIPHVTIVFVVIPAKAGSHRPSFIDRRGPRDALALGPGYNNNLNQSSASRTCLLAAPNGVCLLERTMPAPIAALGLNFEGRAGLRRPLGGHHGLSLRAME